MFWNALAVCTARVEKKSPGDVTRGDTSLVRRSKQETMTIKTVAVLLLAGCMLLPAELQSQDNFLKINAGFTGVAGTGQYAPFWLTANRNGKFLPERNAAAFELSVFAEADTSSVFNYCFGLEAYARQGRNRDIWLHQLYAGITLYNIINLRAGIWEEEIGSLEPTLSSGSVIWSGNARPMPKIQLGTPGYVPVPLTRGYAEVSSLLAHGWFIDDRYVKNVLLHHKNIYIRLGGPLPVNIYYGFNHYAQWGGSSPDYEKPFPSDLNSYYRIFFNRAGDTDIPGTPQTWENNKFGNTLGSRNYGIDLIMNNMKAGVYMQDVFEDGSGLRRKNFPDGLWGGYLRLTDKPRLLQAIVYEFLHTKDQSGPTHNDADGNIIGGNDNYFNHAIYQSGWTHYGHTIGTPLITSPVYNGMKRFSELPAHRLHNNRVLAHHVGLEGSLGSQTWYRTLVTYARNYGRHREPFLEVAEQLSLMLEITHRMPRGGLLMGVSFGADRGGLYGNNIGFMLNVQKQLVL